MLLKHIRGICKSILQIALLFINCLLFTGCIGPTNIFPYSSQYIPSSLKGTPKENLAQITWEFPGIVQMMPQNKYFTIDGVHMKSWGRGLSGHKIYLAEGRHTFTYPWGGVCRLNKWIDSNDLIRVWGTTYDVIDPGWVVLVQGGITKGYFNVSKGQKYNWYNDIPLHVTECDCLQSDYKMRSNDPPKSPLAQVLPLEKYEELIRYDNLHIKVVGLDEYRIRSYPNSSLVVQKSPEFEALISQFNIVNIDEFKEPALYTSVMAQGWKKGNLIMEGGTE